MANILKHADKFEGLIKQLNGVISAKVISGEERFREIHVLTNQKRSPKQISRDIQSIYAATFGESLDHKTVSIAQIEVELPDQNIGRVLLEEVRYQSGTDAFAEATVRLRLDDEVFDGSAKGVNTSRNAQRLVIEATLESLHSLLKVEQRVVLEDVEQVTLAKQNVYNVALCAFDGHREDMYVGSAMVRGDDREALVRATLDALNRRIHMVLK